MNGHTLFDKVWDRHVVKTYDDGSRLLYIDRHLVQEVSSPQAFAGLIAEQPGACAGPDAHLAVADHAVPTRFRDRPLPDGLAARQVRQRWRRTRRGSASPISRCDDRRHGIVHVIGPELGFTLPGCTLVCGDSHTSTHGAFGAHRLRHRRQRMRMRLRHADAAAAQAEAHAGRARGIPAPGVGGQGHHPRADRHDRRRRRRRLRDRICRAAIARPLDGSAHDALQHVDRGRQPRRHGRAGRDDLRLRSRAARWRRTAPTGTGRWPIGGRCAPTPTRVFDREVALDVSALAPQVSLGHGSGGNLRRSTVVSPIRTGGRSRPARPDASAACAIWD